LTDGITVELNLTPDPLLSVKYSMLHYHTHFKPLVQIVTNAALEITPRMIHGAVLPTH